MAKFKFKLNTLRKIRENHRDEMQAKLAEAIQAQQMLQQQLDMVQQELDALQATHRETLANMQSNVNQLLETQRYQSVLRAQQSTMQGQMQVLEAEIQNRRQALVEANREVRVLDNLEDRQRAAHRKEQELAEIKELDEIASRQSGGNQAWA